MRPELTVLIPVLDWDLSLLLTALVHEIDTAGLAGRVRILIGDDGSRPEIRRANRAAVAGVEHVRLFENPARLGRSGNRNRLIGQVRTGAVLFLDGDVLPDQGDFLRQYLETLNQGKPVVCGGYSYRTRIMTGPEYDFYLYKGRKTEWLPARRRQQTPWRYLFTGNVLVERSLLDRIPFDESFAGYGYEDIEWGIRLEREAGILHIDNPVSHLGLVKKEDALVRMQGSVDNFLRLRALHPSVFGRTGVAGPLALLRLLPVSVLRVMDRVLTGTFRRMSWNPALLLCFQLDKAVRMALALRGNPENR